MKALGAYHADEDVERADADGRIALRGRALSAIGAAVVILDGAGTTATIADVNPAVTDLTGYAPAEVLGKPFDVLISPASGAAARVELRRSVRERRQTTVTLLACRKDGSEFWANVRLSPLPGNDPGERAGVHMVAVLTDVSASQATAMALEEASAQARLLFQHHPHPMWIFDIETLRFLAVNEAAIHHYGYSEEEFLRMTLLDIRPPADAAAILAKVAYVTAHPDGLDVAGTWQHRRKDGSIVAMEVVTHATTYQGRPARLSVATDITARAQAQAALAASEARLQAILDNTLSVIYVKDRSGRYLLVNRQFCRIFKREPAAVIGQSDFDIHPAPVAERLRANDATVMSSGEAIEVEETALLDDGPHTYISIKFPLRDTSGAITAVCGISTDISERKQTEINERFIAGASTLLASSLDYQTTLTRVAQLAVPHLADWCVIDTIADDGSLQRLAVAHVDPAKAEYGWELSRRYPEDAETGALAQIIRTHEPLIVPVITDETLVAGAKDDEHLRIMRELGFNSAMAVPLVARDRTVGVLSLIAAESGRHYGDADLALAQDLARRCAVAIDNSRLYGESQAAIRARDQFLSIAAHELRTPVSGVKGYAQMLLRAQQRDLLTPERLVQGLRTINQASDRLVVLTNDLLDVSRIRLGQLPLRPRAFDLAALARDRAARLAEELSAAYEVDAQIPAQPVPVTADLDRIEQVLDNLLENAVKYSPEGGRIVVRVQPDAAGVLLQVEDAGIGLPPGAEETIFQPFGRAANATQRQVPGLGLGLFIARSVTERHGGRIWAESAGDNRGTTVSVWLPRKDAA